MSNWKQQIINFGIVKRNENKTFVFEPLVTAPEIKSVTAHCGCTKASYSPERRQVIVRYSAGEIPNQVQGDQAVSKSITVNFVDGTSDILTIEGIKTR